MEKLRVEKLKRYIDPAILDFETTDEVPALEGIIGQDRAQKAMEFGVKIKQKGYNIFITGITGTGRTSFAATYIKEIAKKEKKPNDWVYVYNFEKPSQPIAIELPAGLGKEFKKDMEEFVEQLQKDIPKAFESDSYEMQKGEIVKKYQEKKNELIENLNELARNYGFVLRDTRTGLISIPVIEGRQINQEEFQQLDEEVRKEIEKKAAEFEVKAMQVWKEIQLLDKQAREEIKKLDNDIGLFAVGHLIDELKAKYSEYESVTNYLESVKKDILENIDSFKAIDGEASPFPFLRKEKGFLKKYMVNLFVDNSNTEGAPVVFEYNPNYNNLVGNIEYESDFGVATTDFTKIKAGALHKANGGYLILQAKDVLSYPFAWDALKRSLKTEKVIIENISSQYGFLSISSLKPEPIRLSVKVILIGTPYLYYLLYNYDEDFSKLFKVKVDFNEEMELNEENIRKLSSFIKTHCIEDNLKPFDKTAVARVIEYSTRLSEDQNKLSTRFNEIVEVLYEADAWATLEGSEVVTEEHVKKAIEEKIKRVNKLEEKMLEYFKKDIYLVEVTGERVGCVNGLAVIDLGDYEFGKPSKITVTTYPGEEGVVNIERESKMSGRIHDKGVMILTGYLGSKFAKDFPLTLSARIVFEQSYEGVEGDSASSTELYALLSSLSDVPIKQGIAVTGSVNQFGEIQPVGGVTHKIEGFYKVCKEKGLTGDQGVIIPYQNVSNLVLSDEVIEAVEKGLFHIYSVKTVEEGMEILTGRSFEEIYERAYNKLKYYYELLTNKKEDKGEKK
ncbi:MAG: putative ATP-dependent protease [Caldanaerobacter subterraneus]|uniref:endopeptidase La n=1 Tax=Caldanaerobacter subterraneus TaxID=911092 RepID=A0A101E735_9THEO|nr:MULTISPECIES: ATP-binding protein [Caldanaerobacter]KUK09495.1 MAG: putative ATP-dependent protease [Caldanaerobacter subterraneus]MCS3915455.1 Lon-like ATP-dependent protease [Caldanaerobacter subterraneus subsp. tengcongensis MB4]MDI3519067.1 ATP-dependent Lon protease [Caldanaerobacter sp.]MDK2794608.1 ATP-dependent Lon protease [Caldanaerobacter sp.]HBT49941.1 ATP-dependent protease [Caldanaerobacter subterraneus]